MVQVGVAVTELAEKVMVLSLVGHRVVRLDGEEALEREGESAMMRVESRSPL